MAAVSVLFSAYNNCAVTETPPLYGYRGDLGIVTNDIKTRVELSPNFYHFTGKFQWQIGKSNKNTDFGYLHLENSNF